MFPNLLCICRVSVSVRGDAIELPQLQTIVIRSGALNHIENLFVQRVPAVSSASLEQESLRCVQNLLVEGRRREWRPSPIGVKKNAYIVDALCSFKGSLSFYLNGQYVGPCNSLVFWTVCWSHSLIGVN